MEFEHPTNRKTYLGDGAYVEIGSYRGEVILTTSDGLTTQNTIVLGPTELAALDHWRAAE